MKMLRILPLFILATLAFASCKKDDATPLPTKTEMLADGKWTLTSLTVSPAYVVNGIPIRNRIDYPMASWIGKKALPKTDYKKVASIYGAAFFV